MTMDMTMDMGLRTLALSFAILSSPVHADFAAQDYPPYERCALCHGLFGVSRMGKFPNLAGQKPAYLTAQITAFLDGQRSNDGGQMAAIVTELQPNEIAVVVDWFATQSPPAAYETGNTLEGHSTFEALGCGSCHFDPLNAAPHLTAQHPGYLLKQMGDFRDDLRTGGPIADLHRSLLQDAPIEAISDYLAGTDRP